MFLLSGALVLVAKAAVHSNEAMRKMVNKISFFNILNILLYVFYYILSVVDKPAPVALLVVSRYALPGYSDQQFMAQAGRIICVRL